MLSFFLTRARGCKADCPTPSLSACVPACVRRLRPGRARARTLARHTNLTPKANQTSKCIPGSPSQPHRNPWKNDKNTVCAMFATQRRRPHLRKKSRSLNRRLARHAGMRCWQSMRGCRGCWRGCWQLSGAICTVFTVFFEGRAEARGKAREAGDVLGSKCLGRPACR